MRAKVINIHASCPPYEYLSPGEKPEHYWEKPDGRWLGFWPQEWPDLLGGAVLKETDQYEWEVWQHDYRADRIYSHTLSTGVTHRLFPAIQRKYRIGIQSHTGYFSEEIIRQVTKAQDTTLLLQIHGLRIPSHFEILQKVGSQKKFPIIIVTHGMIIAPIEELYGLHRPLTYLNLVLEQRYYSNLLRYADVIIAQNHRSRKSLEKIYQGRIETLFMGCDFNFWKPVESRELKSKIRRKLGIDDNKKVFLIATRLVPVKQLDKLIKAFSKISFREDFLFLIAGHSKKNYLEYLKALLGELRTKGKAILLDYIEGEKLRDLYWASDVFISSSKEEGNPVSVMKAMACGLPVLSTPVGETADRMKKHNAGRLMPVNNYNEWTKAILEILDKGMPRVLDREIAREAYHWPNVAKRFINIYDEFI